ncbi:MAG: VCBS repeat-containing protein [Planctomycetota bacterium]
MIPLLLFAGLVLQEIPLDDPVVAAQVADVDADGTEEIVAVTKKHLVVLRNGKEIARHDAPPVTIVGKGLMILGTRENLASAGLPQPLVGSLGRGDPVLLRSPGDLDGDGRDDPIYATQSELFTPERRFPMAPQASLEIRGREAFAVQYSLPVPVVGGWSGRGREVVLYDDSTVRALARTGTVRTLELPLRDLAKSAEGIRQNAVFIEDLDGDGRLDLLLVMAKGEMRVFADFQVTVWFFRGGRIYDEKRKGFFRPATVIKVPGALLGARLLDADGDGDKDFMLATMSTSMLSVPTGQYQLFRCEKGVLARQPTWKHEGVVPLENLRREPKPPAAMLPDLDGDGRPELVVRGERTTLFRGNAKGGFDRVGAKSTKAQQPVIGRTRAVFITEKGVLIARGTK